MTHDLSYSCLIIIKYFHCLYDETRIRISTTRAYLKIWYMFNMNYDITCMRLISKKKLVVSFKVRFFIQK